MHRIFLAFLLAAFIVPSQSAMAQTSRDGDTESVDAIIAALYDVISGPAAEERDWDRFKSLMHADAKLIPSGQNRQGAFGARFLTVDEYVELAGPSFAAQGFFESEIHRVSEEFGQISHIFSTYESRRTEDGEPFTRGINSIQLLNDGTRWWIINIFWQGESAEHAIPAKYLPAN